MTITNWILWRKFFKYQTTHLVALSNTIPVRLWSHGISHGRSPPPEPIIGTTYLMALTPTLLENIWFRN